LFSDRTNWNLTPNRLSEALAQHRATGKPLLDLTASNPTEVGFAYDSQAILQALSNPAALTYRPDPKGSMSARHAVALYCADRGASLSIDTIILTTGTSEAYSFVFRTLCNPGDEILVPTPSYPLFDFLANIQDVHLIRYPLVYDNGWQIDFQSLEAAITPRTRGIIVVHPNNPTGHFARPEDIAKLNQICSSREMAIIADEVFLDFSAVSNPAVSFAGNKGALTFTMSGLSKISGLPQMKVAWIVTSGPSQRQARARLEVIADTYLSVSTPAQLATPLLLGERRAFQNQVMSRLRANLNELDRQLSAQTSCSRLAVEGGWYAVLRVPATRSDEDLAIELLARDGVYVHPGHFYDFRGDGFLVVSLIAPERDFAEGIRRLMAKFEAN
jgi:alanine-synthesizing transaminase